MRADTLGSMRWRLGAPSLDALAGPSVGSWADEAE
jgi:hypothetical protein